MKRIKQITDEIEIKWKHVPTKMNHADTGSRGASYRQLEKMSWWNGSYWLVNQSSWPDQENQSHENDEEIQKEVKVNKEQLLVTSTTETVVDTLLGKGTLRKAKRFVAWCLRFVHNCKSKMLKIQRRSGPLATEEVEKANTYLIIKTQEGVDLNSREAQKLGLTLFNDGIVRCIGRIQSEEPIIRTPHSFIQPIIHTEGIHICY